MLSAACLLVSAAILFYILKYRVHIHVTYEAQRTPGRSERKGRTVSAKVGAATRSTVRPIRQRLERDEPGSSKLDRSGDNLREVTSALINLGCAPAHARKAAARACSSGAQDFDALLRRAIQEAA